MPASNPFRYGEIVTGNDFCGRYAEVDELISKIESGQNLYIKGRRRIGKSSLVQEAAGKVQNTTMLFCDLMGVLTLGEICRRIAKPALILEAQGTSLGKLVSFLTRLRPKMEIDVNSGTPSIPVDTRGEAGPETLEDVLDLLAKMGENRKTVVVLDELQDILKVKDGRSIMALMRGRIQRMKGTTFIFCGSDRSGMDAIFQHPDSPFFKSAAAMPIDAIARKDLSKHIRSKLSKGGRTIDNEALEHIFNLADDVTGDIFQLCENVWDETSPGEAIERAAVDKAMSRIFHKESDHFRMTASELSITQRKCLTGIIKLGGANISSKKFLEETGLTMASSSHGAAKALLSKRIIDKTFDGYRVFNPFFAAWFLKNMDY